MFDHRIVEFDLMDFYYAMFGRVYIQTSHKSGIDYGKKKKSITDFKIC